MKYVKRYIILISIALLSFASCIKEVEFTGEETAPLPVLNCVVGDGDTVVYADLTKSLFFLRRGDFAPITDAEVVITCNGTDYPMTLVNDSVYMLRHTFAAGDVVSISATMPEFGTITSSTTTVPPKLDFVRVYCNKEDGEDIVKSLTLKFENKAPQNSYYQIKISRRLRSNEYDNMSWWWYWSWDIEKYEYISCNDTRILFTNTDFPSITEGRYILFPAKNFQGDTVSITIELDNPQQMVDEYKFFCVDIFSISESLYKYISTANNFYSSHDNPFTEPVQVYTNISGGLGVLGTISYTPKSVIGVLDKKNSLL